MLCVTSLGRTQGFSYKCNGKFPRQSSSLSWQARSAVSPLKLGSLLSPHTGQHQSTIHQKADTLGQPSAKERCNLMDKCLGFPVPLQSSGTALRLIHQTTVGLCPICTVAHGSNQQICIRFIGFSPFWPLYFPDHHPNPIRNPRQDQQV